MIELKLEAWVIVLIVIGLIAFIIGVAITAALGGILGLSADSKTGENKCVFVDQLVCQFIQDIVGGLIISLFVYLQAFIPAFFFTTDIMNTHINYLKSYM